MPYKTVLITGVLTPHSPEPDEPVPGIDTGDMAKKIEEAANLLEGEGYSVVSVIPITKGAWRHNFQELENRIRGGTTWGDNVWAGGWAYGFGFGRTEDIIIIAKK